MGILGLENNYALHARKVQSVRILNMRTITNIKCEKTCDPFSPENMRTIANIKFIKSG